MILIPPAELSGKVMTLIDQCHGRMVIISPYVQLRCWKKLAHRITTSQRRGVSYDWYYRSDQDYAGELSRFNISGIPVNKLHAKIYYNQEQALVTSMNLYHYSDTFSIDIGYLTETPEEYAEIVKFVECYIKPAVAFSENTDSRRGAVAEEISSNPLPALHREDSTLFVCGQNLSKNLHLIRQVVSDHVEQLVIGGLIRRNQVSHQGFDTTVVDYWEGVDLIVDVHNSYDRILLQTKGDNYQAKRQRYELLKSNLNALDAAIGASFDYGSQMKRLKWKVTTAERTVRDGKLNANYTSTLTEHLDRAFGPLRAAVRKLPQPQSLPPPAGRRMTSL